MKELSDLVARAQAGDIDAFGRLVSVTQVMTYAVARGILRDTGMAEDAAQEAYLRAFRRLHDLEQPSGFIVWLRRIVITVALNMRRTRRLTLMHLDDVLDVPVLDEAETTWSELQRRRLAGALLTLTDDERRLCDRRYHGLWSIDRLAHEAGIAEPIMRKRLQRVLKLRYEGEPLQILTAGKAYRHGQIDATHLEAFHQAEVFRLDERRRLDPWQMTAHVLRAVDVILPGRAVRISPTQYPMCSQAWELGVDEDGQWREVLAWGVFTDKIVRHVGADPGVHTAIGVGCGLERLAMLRYGIDDIRKVERARVA
jgi:RNA polymerase sigma-70 factor (ECF subfamily)